MPKYSVLNKRTKKVTEEVMPYAELEKYLAANPHLEQVITHAPSLGDPIRVGQRKPEQGFRDLLKEVKKKAGRRSTINTM
jgi:hypothetical protein